MARARLALLAAASLVTLALAWGQAGWLPAPPALPAAGRPGEPWLAIAGVGLLGLLALWAMRTPATPPSTHGSARLAGRRDLAGLRLPAGAATDGVALPPGAVLLAPDASSGRRGGRALHLPPAVAARHVLLVAPPGAGKTRALVLPNCAAIREHSFVVTDPKGEAWRLTGGLHPAAVGFAPRDPDASACFNWIPACVEPATAALLAEAALQLDEDRGEQLFWRQSALVLCAALFAHAATTVVPTPATAYALLEAPDLLAVLDASPARQARRAAAALAGVDGKVRAAIVLDVQNRLSFLDDPAVRRMTSADLAGPDFGALRRRPTAVYWRLPEQDLATLRPLSALFWTLLLSQLVATEGLPVTLLLDEFGNLGRLPRFETTIAVARGRGVGVVLVAQSLGQLEAVYGRGHARTIRDCCATSLTLGGGLDLETARWFAALTGDATVVIETESRRAGGRGWWGGQEVSRNQQHVRRTLLTPDEVRRLPQGELLAIVADRPPLRLRTFRYDAPPRPGRATPLGPEQGLAFDAEPRPTPGAGLRLVRPAGPPPDEAPLERP